MRSQKLPTMLGVSLDVDHPQCGPEASAAPSQTHFEGHLVRDAESEDPARKVQAHKTNKIINVLSCQLWGEFVTQQ